MNWMHKKVLFALGIGILWLFNNVIKKSSSNQEKEMEKAVWKNSFGGTTFNVVSNY